MQILGVRVIALMMAAMAVTVHAASLGHHNPKQLLQQIRHAADKTEKNVPLDKAVTITPRNKKICVTEFFCWAEKILKEVESDLPENHSLNKLTRLVHVYNTEVRNISCPLDTNGKYELGIFLEDIKSCTDFAS